MALAWEFEGILPWSEFLAQGGEVRAPAYVFVGSLCPSRGWSPVTLQRALLPIAPVSGVLHLPGADAFLAEVSEVTPHLVEALEACAIPPGRGRLAGATISLAVLPSSESSVHRGCPQGWGYPLVLRGIPPTALSVPVICRELSALLATTLPHPGGEPGVHVWGAPARSASVPVLLDTTGWGTWPMLHFRTASDQQLFVERSTNSCCQLWRITPRWCNARGGQSLACGDTFAPWRPT